MAADKEAAMSVLNISQIMEILPHRQPMLLIDSVEEIEYGVRAVAKKCVSFNEPFFAGHFPEEPVMPGFRKPPYHPAFRQNRDCSLQARFFTATHRTQRLPDCASTVYRNRRSIFPKSSNARGTKFADYPNTFYDLPI